MPSMPTSQVNRERMTSFIECFRCGGSGRFSFETCRECKGTGMVEDDEWDDYEEDGPTDLEDQLETALDRAFG